MCKYLELALEMKQGKNNLNNTQKFKQLRLLSSMVEQKMLKSNEADATASGILNGQYATQQLSDEVDADTHLLKKSLRERYEFLKDEEKKRQLREFRAVERLVANDEARLKTQNFISMPATRTQSVAQWMSKERNIEKRPVRRSSDYNRFSRVAPQRSFNTLPVRRHNSNVSSWKNRNGLTKERRRVAVETVQRSVYDKEIKNQNYDYASECEEVDDIDSGADVQGGEEPTIAHLKGAQFGSNIYTKGQTHFLGKLGEMENRYRNM